MSLKRTYIYMMGLGLMGVVVLLAGLATGYTPIGWIDIIQALLGGEVEKGNVIWDLRLPRVLLAFCAGGVLTLGGFYMQSLIRNPLADPYIMGVTAGAGLGVNLLILGLIPITAYTIFTYPLFAGVGALSSLLLVVLMGFRAMFEDSARLLIAGVAVASIYTAATGVMIYMLAEDDQVRRIVFWAFGSLAYAQWEDVYVSGILLALGLGFGWIYARRLDLLLLGDRQAHYIGDAGTSGKMGGINLVFADGRRNCCIYGSYRICRNDDSSFFPSIVGESASEGIRTRCLAGRHLLMCVRYLKSLVTSLRGFTHRNCHSNFRGSFLSISPIFPEQVSLNLTLFARYFLIYLFRKIGILWPVGFFFYKIGWIFHTSD